jgi:hypothetical protein
MLREQISAGIYQPGQQIPSEKDLSLRFDLSRTCIRRALSELQKEGWVEARRGHGHFATDARKRSAPRCQDTALVMGVNFLDWNISNPRCLLYSLLDQYITQRGCRFTHIQVGKECTVEFLAMEVERVGAPWLVMDQQVFSMVEDQALLWCLFQSLPARLLLTGSGAPFASLPVDQVTPDWEIGAREATEYAIGCGHQHILFAGVKGLYWSDTRQGAFLAAMRRAGRWEYGQARPCIVYPGELVLSEVGAPAEVYYEAIASHVLACLKTTHCDALICANDILAQHLARQAPLDRLPEIIGFDNSPWAKEHDISSVGTDVRLHTDKIFETLSVPESAVCRIIRVPTALNRRGVSTGRYASPAMAARNKD